MPWAALYESLVCRNKIVRRAAPLGGDVAQCQLDQFAGSLVRREMAARLDDLAHLRVYAFDGIGIDTRRTAGGNARNGITFDQARRQDAATVGNF